MAVTGLQEVGYDLREFKNLGGNCVVDTTTVDYGRDLGKLNELSKHNGVFIIGCGGFNKGKFNRSFLEFEELNEVVRRIHEDVLAEVGVGVVKIGTSLNSIEEWELKGLKAISEVHKITGVPITTHTEKGTFGLEQLALFKREGVHPSAIIIGHIDQNPDFEIHKRIIQQGAFIGYDSVAKAKYKTKDRAIEFIIQFAKIGLHKQIVISGDFARKDYYKGYGGEPGLRYLLSDFKTELRARLLENELDAESIVNDLFINNPARALAFRF